MMDTDAVVWCPFSQLVALSLYCIILTFGFLMESKKEVCDTFHLAHVSCNFAVYLFVLEQLEFCFN